MGKLKEFDNPELKVWVVFFHNEFTDSDYDWGIRTIRRNIKYIKDELGNGKRFFLRKFKILFSEDDKIICRMNFKDFSFKKLKGGM